MSRVKKGLSLFEKTKEAGRKAAKATAETAKGAAIRAGSPGSGTKVVKGTTTRNLGKGFGLQQTGAGKGTRAATKAQRSKVARSGAKRIGGAAATVGVGTALTRGERKQAEKKKDQPKAKKFNVGVSKGGVPFNEAFKHFRDKGQKQFTWNGKKYTTELDTEKKKRLETKRKKDLEAKKSKGIKGAVKTILFGKDQVMGGKGGVLDNPLTRPFTKRDEKNFPKKAGGGMMKAKGMAKGGKMMKKGYAMGGAAMKKKGYKKGGAAGKFPDLTGDGKVTQKDILKGRGVPGFKKGGAMTKKGYAKGGMAKKGYAKGGAAMKAKGGKKGGVRRGKPRGVGVALRGYGKALK